jgi:hypothetical protein
MLLLRATRWGWRGLLAAMPAPVLAWLDGWAQRQAHRKAQRRRKRLAAAHR